MLFNVCKMIGLGLLLLMSACSSLTSKYREFAPDRDTEYLEAQASPPLELPEGMHLVENYHSPYIIPAGPLPEGDEPISLVPPGNAALLERAQAELAQQGESEEGDE